jgi:hypothetical protein
MGIAGTVEGGKAADLASQRFDQRRGAEDALGRMSGLHAGPQKNHFWPLGHKWPWSSSPAP